MKILCPKCDVTVILRVEKKSPEMGKCPKCGIVIYASYEKDGGRNIWEVRMEKTVVSKPKKRSEAPFWVVVLSIIGVLVWYFWNNSGAQ